MAIEDWGEREELILKESLYELKDFNRHLLRDMPSRFGQFSKLVNSFVHTTCPKSSC